MMRPSLMAGLLMSVTMFLGCGGLPRALDPLIATRSAKYRMLGEAVQKFHTALNWGDPSAATEFVDPNSLERFQKDVLGPAAGQRVTEVRVDQIDFPQTEENKAFVYSTIRYYGLPSIQVRAYSARQTWRYSRMDGLWMFVEAEKAPLRDHDPGAMGGFIR